jgi:hypothetical protein
MKAKTPPRELAFRIAVRFPHFAPTGKQVHEAFPEIGRATAYRYARDYHRAWRARAA